jgi:hypothetical protein
MMLTTEGILDDASRNTGGQRDAVKFDAALVLHDLEAMAVAAQSWEISLGPSAAQMPAGHNGPYFDVETPIRNTAHWLSLFSILYEATGKPNYKARADRLYAYLASPGFARNGYAYTHRQKPGKDWCNGVIGAAWVIEALIRYGRYTRNEEARNLARQIAASCPFDDRQGAWKRLDPVKGPTTIDATYNHQAWLAAAIAEADVTLANRASLFLDRSVEGAFHLRPNGRIDHLMYLRGGLNRAAQIKHALQSVKDDKKVSEKEDGYHLFVLFALARLKRTLPNHPFFSTDVLRRSLQYVAEPAFVDKLANSHYAYPYNAPGFELPLILAVFRSFEPSLETVDCLSVYEEQKRRTFSDQVGLYVDGCPDPCTLAARAYELAMGLEAMVIPAHVAA